MLFGALDDNTLHALARKCHTRSYAKGAIVLMAGEPGGDILIVASGRLRVMSRSPDGNDVFLADTLPGDTLGELSLFDLEPRSATVEAAERSVVVTVPRDTACALIRDKPDLAEELLRQQAIMLRRANGLVSDLLFLDLPRRVAKFVMGRAGTQEHADLGLSQSELAAAVGGARQTVNGALRGFERRGWIHVEGRTVHILDRDALTEFVHAGR